MNNESDRQGRWYNSKTFRTVAIVTGITLISACAPASPTISASPVENTPSTLPSGTQSSELPHEITDLPVGVHKAEDNEVIPANTFIMVRAYNPSVDNKVYYYFITTTQDITYENPTAGTVNDIFLGFNPQNMDQADDFGCFNSGIDKAKFEVTRLFDC